ncbi:hypothetical protein [Clostridium sporogenes]
MQLKFGMSQVEYRAHVS